MYHPLRSLREGNWFKLICGASFQHLPAVRNLTLAYTLAGVDCIDVAADSAVVAAARDALQVAVRLAVSAGDRGFGFRHLPWLMVSLNDGEDPHFRKAEFNPELCPKDCPRPCQAVCPAQAIVFDRGDCHSEAINSGVVDSRCYGCGRCVPICPTQQISTRAYVSTPAAIAPLVLSGVDAVEIHTQVGRLADFERLWRAIAPSVNHLKLVAISCPDGEGLIDYLWALHNLVSPLPCPLVWQTDGRPMSGDIGDGATRAAVRLGQKVLAAELPGYVQLAGGTNNHTVPKLRALGLLKAKDIPLGNIPLGNIPLGNIPLGNIPSKDNLKRDSLPATKAEPSSRQIAGIAYGSYARVLLAPVLSQLEQSSQAVLSPSPMCLEAFPHLLWQAVALANGLVAPLKSDVPLHSTVSN